MNNNDKIELSEKFFSFTSGKLGLLNCNIRTTSIISLTPSPNRFFKEDIINMPDIELSTSTQSTTPTGTTFSLSNKNKFFVPTDSQLETFLQLDNKTNEIAKYENEQISQVRLDLIQKKRAKCLCSNSKILSLSTKNSDKNKSVEIKEEDIFKIECKCEETLKEAKEAILDVIHSQKKQKIYREDKESNSIKIQTDIGANRLVKTKFNEIKSKKQIEDDLGSLTNSQEIRDFHEYTEESIKRMKNIIQNNDLNAYKYVELDEKYIDLIKSGKKKLAVFDLDETLMHREYENYQNCDSVIKVQLPNSGNVEIGIYLRPHLFECIKEINKYYVLTIFTASQQIYADKVLELIDPNNEFFVKRLYRDSCRKAILEGETIFIKDIQIFKNVPQQKIVIIDNSVLSFCNQIENGIPILPFYSNRDDTELLDLILYLNHLYNANDIRVENKKIIGLQKYYQSNNENSCSSFTDEEENVNENKVIFSKADNLYNDLSDSKYLISSSDLSDFSDCLDTSKINLTDSDRKFDKKSSNKELFLYLEIFQKKYDLLCKKQSSN